MTPNYPDCCVQALCKSWWQVAPKKRQPWSLAYALVRHVSETPYVLQPVGRDGKHAGDHTVACYNLSTLANASSDSAVTNLPIAAIPHYSGETLTISRAKKRPVLIIANSGTPVESDVRRHASRSKFAPVYLVAPFYSAESGGVREGFKETFVDRVRCLRYKQFLWDQLPHQRGRSSILRLDHIQPVEPDICNLEPLPWVLSAEAQEFLMEAILLHVCGIAPQNEGLWASAHELLASYPRFEPQDI